MLLLNSSNTWWWGMALSAKKATEIMNLREGGTYEPALV